MGVQSRAVAGELDERAAAVPAFNDRPFDELLAETFAAPAGGNAYRLDEAALGAPPSQSSN